MLGALFCILDHVYFRDMRFCAILRPASPTKQKKTTSHLRTQKNNRVSVGIEHIDDIKADFEQAISLAVSK